MYVYLILSLASLCEKYNKVHGSSGVSLCMGAYRSGSTFYQ